MFAVRFRVPPRATFNFHAGFAGINWDKWDSSAGRRLLSTVATTAQPARSRRSGEERPLFLPPSDAPRSLLRFIARIRAWEHDGRISERQHIRSRSWARNRTPAWNHDRRMARYWRTPRVPCTALWCGAGRWPAGRGPIQTNTIEGYFSLFKRGMKGVYQHCAKKQLHRYAAEFEFRYNNRHANGINDRVRTDAVLRGAGGRRLTYAGPSE